MMGLLHDCMLYRPTVPTNSISHLNILLFGLHTMSDVDLVAICFALAYATSGTLYK